MCTVALFVHLLGYMPAPGTVITVPKEHSVKYSQTYKSRAIKCAKKYGIELREEG